MAVEVLFTIAGGILKTLAPLITDEIVLLWGFHDELQNLERTVTTIQAVLLDAEARRATSNAVSIWLGQLNDILYEADDLLDAISTEVQLGKITRDKNAKKEMKLKKCPNLKGWWGGSPTKAESLLIPFPLLSKLEIENCPVLTSMPMFPHLEEPLFPLLRWRNGWKLLEQTLVLAVSLCTPLSKLENIEFESVIDLEALPEAGLQGLAFLKILRFKSCDKLKSLSPGVQHLATVQELFIKHCPIFVDEEDGMQWQGLRNLHLLHFENLPKLSSLPLGLQHVTTLKKLKILNCESLMAIPEWIHQCKLLKELYVYGCSNLASLPVETCEPWSLRRLVIWKCLILSKKCETEKGEYWPKISHIQQLQVEPPESKSVLRRMCYEFGFMEPDEPWGIFE